MRGLELSGSRMTDDTVSERIKRKQITLNQMMVCGLGSKGRCRQIVWNSLAFIRHMTFFKHTSSFFFVSKWTFKSNIKTLVKVIWVYVKFITNDLFLPVSSPPSSTPPQFHELGSLLLELKGKTNSRKALYAIDAFGFVMKSKFWESLEENNDCVSY